MQHDFKDPKQLPRKDKSGKPCTNIGGIMDYGQTKTYIWSTCSVEDFKAYVAKSQGKFCLQSS